MTIGPETDGDGSVSLAPLTPEEALRALLAVKPDDSPDDDQAHDFDQKNDEAPAD